MSVEMRQTRLNDVDSTDFQDVQLEQKLNFSSENLDIAVPLSADQFDRITNPIVRQAMKKTLYINWTNIAA